MLSFIFFSLEQERKDQRFLPVTTVLPKRCGHREIRAMVQSEHNLYFALSDTREKESSYIYDLAALHHLEMAKFVRRETAQCH